MTTLIAGKYELLEPLGESATGAVYKVRHPVLESFLTVTIPSEPLSTDPDRLASFQAAVRRACALRHDHIVPVLDLVEDAGRYHVVEACVDGEPLDRLLRARGPMPAADALLVARQIAGALGHAHDQGIVHGALTPANVLVVPSTPPRALVTGFAAAALAPAAPSVSPYTAPERLRAAVPDARTDVFGVGLLLFEMIEGRPLLGGTPEEIERALLDGGAPLLPRFARIVPSGVPALVARAVRRAPSARQQSMTKLGDDIDAALRRVGERRVTERQRLRPVLVVDTLADEAQPEPAAPDAAAAPAAAAVHETPPARQRMVASSAPAAASRVRTVTRGTGRVQTPRLGIATVIGIALLALAWPLLRSHRGVTPVPPETPAAVESAPSPTHPSAPHVAEPEAPAETATAEPAEEPVAPEKAPAARRTLPSAPARNRPPRIVARQPDGRGPVHALEGEAVAFSVRATDRNPGDALEYTWFVDGRQVGRTPRFRFVAPITARGVIHSVQVRVSDGARHAAPHQSWIVQVTPRMTERDVRDWLSRLAAAWERKDMPTLRLYGIVTADAEAEALRRRLARYGDDYRVTISNEAIRTDRQYATVGFDRTEFAGRGTRPLGAHHEVYRIAKQPNGFVGLQPE